MLAAAKPFFLELWENTKALGLTVIVHAMAAALIVFGTMDWKKIEPPRQITGMTIEAVIVDTQALRDRKQAAQREAEAAERRKQRQEQRQRDLADQRQRERQAAAEAERQAERDRQAEVERKRQADLKLQQLRLQQQKEREDKIAQQQAELEAIQKQRQAAERDRRLEEERMKQLEARRTAEADAQKQAEAEAAMQQQMAAEQQAFRAGQLATLGDNYYAAIQSHITNNWMRPPSAQSGLRCTLSIVQIPGGEVISSSIRGSCNADEATRRSLIQAVERAGALPYRGFEDVFTREIDFIFRYDDL